MLDQLTRFDLFTDLDPEAAERAKDLFVQRSFAEGEHIISAGDTGTDVFFLLEGSVRVVTYSVIGSELELSRFEAPGYFGELTALDDAPRSAEVLATKPCTCLCMDSTDFQKFLIANPPALMRLAQRLARQVRESNVAVLMSSTI